MIRLGDSMKIAVVVALGAALAGCVSARIKDAQAQMDSEIAACDNEPKTTRMALARCINAAEEKAALAAQPDGMDLVRLRTASRLEISERVDKGQITQAQAELEFAKVNAQIGSQQATRTSSAEMAAAATQMAAPRMRTCNRIGNTVTCF